MRGSGALLAALLAVATLGCNAGRAFVVTPNDYGDYRLVRTAETLDGRLAASWHYLKERPDGAYAKRLRRYFNRVEPVYFKVRQQDETGLRAYLTALPDGPHATEALELLTDAKTSRRRGQYELRRVRTIGMRLEAEKAMRRDAADALSWWVGSLMSPPLWQAPLTDAPGAFLARYRMSLPAPECEMDMPEEGWQQCYKSIERRFKVRANSGVVERTLRLDLALTLDSDWRLRRTIVTGPELFLTTVEAAEQQAAGDEDERDEFIAAAVQSISERLLGLGLECRGGIDADGDLEMRCDDLVLTMRVGSAGSDDEIGIAPAEDDEGDEGDEDDEGVEGDEDDEDDEGDEGDEDDEDDEDDENPYD